MRRASALAALAALLIMPVALPTVQAGEAAIEIMHPWAKPSLPNRPAAAYFGIHNNGDEDDRLTGASVEGAAKVEMHDVVTENDVVKMVPLPAIEVPAGGMAHLGPGGMHLMVMGLEVPLEEGETVPVTLIFEKAGEVEVELTVGRMMPAHEGYAGHSGHDHGAMHGSHGEHGHGSHDSEPASD